MNALNICLNEDKLVCWSIVIGISENTFGPKHRVTVIYWLWQRTVYIVMLQFLKQNSMT